MLPVCTTVAPQFFTSEAGVLKANTAQMHYSNASNPCLLFEQSILFNFPSSTSRKESSVELIFCIFHLNNLQFDLDCFEILTLL